MIATIYYGVRTFTPLCFCSVALAIDWDDEEWISATRVIFLFSYGEIDNSVHLLESLIRGADHQPPPSSSPLETFVSLFPRDSVKATPSCYIVYQFLRKKKIEWRISRKSHSIFLKVSKETLYRIFLWGGGFSMVNCKLILYVNIVNISRYTGLAHLLLLQIIRFL